MTLYPVCSGVPPVPRCDKGDLSLGLWRAVLLVFCPLSLGLLLSCTLHGVLRVLRLRGCLPVPEDKVLPHQKATMAKEPPAPGAPGNPARLRFGMRRSCTSLLSMNALNASPDTESATEARAPDPTSASTSSSSAKHAGDDLQVVEL